MTTDLKIILFLCNWGPHAAYQTLQDTGAQIPTEIKMVRIPCAGKVDDIIYMPGKFYSANSKKAALKNEYCATVLTTSKGTTIAFVQVAGLIARRIVCWLEPGDHVEKGKRYGLIRFGSRVDLYLPQDMEITVQPGQTVRGGESVLGYLD